MLPGNLSQPMCASGIKTIRRTRAAILAELGDCEHAMRLLATPPKLAQLMGDCHTEPAARGFRPFGARITPQA